MEFEAAENDLIIRAVVHFVGIAEVVASTPTQSIFNNLVNYGMADYGVVVVADV